MMISYELETARQIQFLWKVAYIEQQRKYGWDELCAKFQEEIEEESKHPVYNGGNK